MKIDLITSQNNHIEKYKVKKKKKIILKLFQIQLRKILILKLIMNSLLFLHTLKTYMEKVLICVQSSHLKKIGCISSQMHKKIKTSH